MNEEEESSAALWDSNPQTLDRKITVLQQLLPELKQKTCFWLNLDPVDCVFIFSIILIDGLRVGRTSGY